MVQTKGAIMNCTDSIEGARDLTWLQMAATGGLIVWAIALCLVLRLHISSRIAIAATRAALQLAALGYVLRAILTTDEPFFVLPYILLMMMLAWREAVVKTSHNYAEMAAHMLLSLSCALALSFVLAAAIVLQPSPWYESRYMIPVRAAAAGGAAERPDGRAGALRGVAR